MCRYVLSKDAATGPRDLSRDSLFLQETALSKIIERVQEKRTKLGLHPLT